MLGVGVGDGFRVVAGVRVGRCETIPLRIAPHQLTPVCRMGQDEEHKKTLREEIERQYYPEKYDFLPFGDPFIHKRKLEERKRRQSGRGRWYESDSD